MEKLALSNKSVLRFWLLIIGITFLAGCAIPIAPRPDLMANSYMPVKYAEKVLEEDVSDVGVIYVKIVSPPVLQSIWIDNLPVSTHDKGFLRYPLYPGEYVLKTQAHGWDAKETPFSIDKGDILYFFQKNVFVQSAVAEVSEEEFYWEPTAAHFGKRVDEVKLQNMVTYTTSPYKFLPESIKKSIDLCLMENTFDTCKSVYNDAPLILIDPRSRERLVNTVEQHKKELAQQALEAALPRDVLRDKYMLALSDALSNKQFDKAIPVFEKLQKMQMPLDPDFYYFYGEALNETGDNEKALSVVSRYIRDNGNKARFYQESLQLLNKIQSSM